MPLTLSSVPPGPRTLARRVFQGRPAFQIRPAGGRRRSRAKLAVHPFTDASAMPDGSATAHLYRPKLVTIFGEGYGFEKFRKDFLAG